MDATGMATPCVTDCLVNGVPTSAVSVRDRGLAYGDGLFETILVRRGEPTLAQYHFRRLSRGARVLRIPLDLALIQQEVAQQAAQLGEGLLKLTVTRGASQRGYAMPTRPEPVRILQSSPLPHYPARNAEQGIRLFPCVTRLGNQPLLAGIKHLNRLEQVLARSEWQDDVHAEGLVLDLVGNPVEGTMSNLFIRLDDAWITPALDHCGVRGVMRDYLIDQLAEQGEAVTQRQVKHDELLRSTEIFCCNSVFGVWPVIALADHQWAVGTQTRRIQALAKQVLS
ncbi:4-amino-4-deoxychorismate lyase [Pseudomonas saudimassiliensis]|uniref:Aminodeoxychorismate lyase n=1 Tax=Pseudomonas saudimassiliensis TaxID=1461581 RepID=A0A078MGM3_9PSED|nr:aminodeoxychorismate lyase [Pseudomonas saudimassiliensis]CEA05464.1 4-amino-4-deoxychorismate lyase [Pseudomonas saudimassiliensis]CEF27154.1 4-amino-4-deoxychorismate lyase [Pseudomonas saudimassiliensis]